MSASIGPPSPLLHYILGKKAHGIRTMPTGLYKGFRMSKNHVLEMLKAPKMLLRLQSIDAVTYMEERFFPLETILKNDSNTDSGDNH